jgi:HAD superfamily hydrolase (TIGR01509 family)
MSVVRGTWCVKAKATRSYAPRTTYYSHSFVAMPLRALIFDVDGTLADTERDGHRIAFNRAFADAGLDWEWDVELYGELLSVTGGKERMRHYAEMRGEWGVVPAAAKRSDGANRKEPLPTPHSLNSDFISRLHASKNRHYEALLAHNDIPLRPGVRSLLEEARAAGVRLAIATTTSPENVSALLSHALPDGEHWFDVIGAGDVVAEKKPAPDIYNWVLRELGLGPSDCVAFEDSENGVRSAVAAGLKTIVARNAYTRNHDFDGASLVVDEFDKVDLATVRRCCGE